MPTGFMASGLGLGLMVLGVLVFLGMVSAVSLLVTSFPLTHSNKRPQRVFIAGPWHFLLGGSPGLDHQTPKSNSSVFEVLLMLRG